jgi:hypothetical protein
MMDMVAKARAVPDVKLLKDMPLSKSVDRGIASYKTYIRSRLTEDEPVEESWWRKGETQGGTIGAPGFEPGAFCSQNRRANQTALRLDVGHPALRRIGFS